MDFRILGPLDALENGRVIDLGGAKQRALLAVLLLHANRVVSSDRLLEALWGERAPETAQKALQVYVSQLRKVLGKERIVTRTPGYQISVEPGELDLDRFQDLVSEGQANEALALWRGAPLADFANEPFAQAEIARLEELRFAALEERIESDLAAGGHGALVGELEALVGEHPLRERVRAQLMLALYRSGRQAESLEAYQEGRRVMIEELGIDPGRPLRELERAILRQDASLDLSAEATDATDAMEASRGVFVGRERELGELKAALDDAFAGRGGLFLLVGEPGIGKSRLADEVIRQARIQGARVLVGRCWEAGGAPAYWPWVQSLRAYLREGEAAELRSGLGAGAADLAQILPELRERFPDLPEPSLETEGARFRLFDALTRFLSNAATARPIVIVLDDLHAADEPSLLMLRFVAGELADSRILLVGTYRDVDPTVRDPLASTLAELAREQVTRRIELPGFTVADVARYIELSAGTTPSEELVATIYTETEGNPLFVGEVVRLLASEGRLAELDAEALWTLGIPQGVREVIGRRVGRLSTECATLLTLATVLGREFELAALERLSELHGEQLFEFLDEAVAARVLASVPGARGRLRFAHALIRETLYDQLTTVRKGQLHRRAGEALEALYGQDREPHFAELAYHFFEAAPGGDVDKAVSYARQAGDRALELLAYEEAARFYELALQALGLKQSSEVIARCELLLACGDALVRAGSTREAKQTFLSAAELARTSNLTEHLARAALGYGGRFPWLRAGSDTLLVPLLEEGLAALGEQESSLRVRLLARLAGALRDQPSLEPRSSLSRQAVQIARRLGDPDTLGYALVSLGPATWGPEIDELATVADEVSRLAQETNNAEQALQAGWLHHIAAMTRGETEFVERFAEEDQARADELRQPSQQWYSTVRRCIWELFQGRFSEAEQLADEALQRGERAVGWDAGLSYRLVLFTLRREQGRLDEIEPLIRESVDNYAGYRALRCFVAVLECELGREDKARQSFSNLAADEFAALPRDGEWLYCISLLAEVAACLRDTDCATTLYNLLLPYARLNALVAGEVAIGSVSRYLGILARTMGRLDDAAGHFEDALEMNERMGARPWVAHAKHDFARLLRARAASGDEKRAGELLAQARRTAEEVGMTALSREMSRIEAMSKPRV